MGSTHEQDFYAWTQEQAELLRAGKLQALDIEHLVEELESMGASERRQLVGRLKILLAHLLKWQYQPQLHSRSWQATLKEQRLSLQDLLEENPSLQDVLEEKVRRAYRLARLLAVQETNLEESVFPEECPFSMKQILDEDYYPG
jgi:hypothetical protein